jgi:hypothetical protein
MARRCKHALPQPRLHKQSGHWRVRIAGETYWLGRAGSLEAIAEFDRLIGEWLASGKTRPPSRRLKTAVEGITKSTASQPADAKAALVTLSTVEPTSTTGSHEAIHVGIPTATFPTNGLTGRHIDPDGLSVGELCTGWLDWIERNRCHNGKDRTSLYYGARQVTKAIEAFWSLPAAAFGSEHLLQVQESLVHTPVVSRPKDPTKPKKIRPRNRTTINDTVNRIRQLFKWGALRKFVPHDRVAELSL